VAASTPSPSPSRAPLSEGTAGVIGTLLAPLVVAAVATAALALLGRLYVDGRLKRLGEGAIADFNAAASRQLETLKGELTRVRSEHEAELAYRYEARRRLYTQLQPLFFQLRSLCADAHAAVHELAGSPELRKDDDRLGSVVHTLMAPQVIVRIIMESLAELDLAVDDRLQHRYALANIITSRVVGDPRPTATGAD
jgi:hypothetical protein